MSDNQKNKGNFSPIKWMEDNPKKSLSALLAVTATVVSVQGYNAYQDYIQDLEAQKLINPDDVVTTISTESKRSYYIDTWDEKYAPPSMTLQECFDLARKLAKSESYIDAVAKVTCSEGDIERLRLLADEWDVMYTEWDKDGNRLKRYDGFDYLQ